MSYNYNTNPWDDTPNYNQNNTSQTTAGGSYSGYGGDYSMSGYNNPTDAWSNNNQQQQQHYDYTNTQQQQQPPAEEDEANYNDQQASERPQKQNQESTCGRFLRAHIPICGTCLDITSPFIDTIFKYVNRDLLVSKVFYFFFYSAFGSLFPLMGVYFKQLGMNPAQVGILTGVRPFIAIFSAPFWNSLAERFQKSKIILLFSLLSWIIFTYSLAHIRPPASACVAFNDTDYVLYIPYSANDLSNYDVGQVEETSTSTSVTVMAPNEKSNVMFMNKMPVDEGKDVILASEENVNEQGRKKRKRRRRRKRSYLTRPVEQIDRPNIVFSQSNYAVEGNEPDVGYASNSDLDNVVDLENDFDDTPLNQANLHPVVEASSFFENPDPIDSSSEYHDELDQQSSHRFKRAYKLSDNDDYSGNNDDELNSEQQVGEDEEEGGNRKSKKKMKEELRRSEQVEESEDDDARIEQHDGEANNGNEGGESEDNADDDDEKKNIKNDVETNKQSNVESTNTQSMQTKPINEPSSGLITTPTTSASNNKTKRIYRQRHKTPPTHIVGMSPITVQYAVNYNREKHSQFVTPMFSTIVYKLDDIKEVFFLLLLLISLGEFFSAPAITIADSITLSYLGENTDLYGRQRMFGSLGWAITLMLVGMALDNSKTIADHPCGPHQRERSYTVCFTIFSMLMGFAFLTATQFKFSYTQSKATKQAGNGSQALVTKTSDGSTVITTTVDKSNLTNVDDVYASTRPREIFNTAPPVNAPPPSLNNTDGGEKFEFLDKWKSAVFAQNTGELPELFNVFRQFRKPMHLIYLFTTWFLGCGVGLVFTFLFWHLQDVGGTPTLFGICSVINHISEVLAYFFSSYFIKRFGHTKVLSVGLGCNVIRFLYVAFLSNPYYALPFELVQGITHAACFAACCSYMSHVSKPELKASTQCVLQGLHNGIGRACGALLGGYMINAIGSRASFCIYGLLSGFMLGGFLYVRKKASVEEADVKIDPNENLGDLGAPQGVPSAIPQKITQNVPASQHIDYQW